MGVLVSRSCKSYILFHIFSSLPLALELLPHEQMGEAISRLVAKHKMQKEFRLKKTSKIHDQIKGLLKEFYEHENIITETVCI